MAWSPTRGERGEAIRSLARVTNRKAENRKRKRRTEKQGTRCQDSGQGGGQTGLRGGGVEYAFHPLGAKVELESSLDRVHLQRERDAYSISLINKKLP